MHYQTYQPDPALQSIVKCFWTLEVPAEESAERQRILPDGCIELIFILGDDVKRITTGNECIIQPRAMVLGQITEPFFVEPTGYVNSFAARFYPYGFANFVPVPFSQLANKDTPIGLLFGEAPAKALERQITGAADTQERIKIMEAFLLERLEKASTIDDIVKSTIDAMLAARGTKPVHAILKDDLSKRRQLERKFVKQIGMSPKQLGKVIRLQAALKMLLNQPTGSLTQIAYENEYYDQAHFTKDFKEFTCINPKDFLADGGMALSALFYRED